jgi:hypothetical protein
MEHSDDGAMLVPAESASAKAALAKAKSETLGAKVFAALGGSAATPWLMLIDRRGFQRRFVGGLCVEVSVPVSPCFRFSIPVGLGDDGRGFCVELVLPISRPEESCPEEGLDAPPAFSAKDTVVVPMKRAIATTAAPILRCILHS